MPEEELLLSSGVLQLYNGCHWGPSWHWGADWRWPLPRSRYIDQSPIAMFIISCQAATRRTSPTSMGWPRRVSAFTRLSPWSSWPPTASRRSTMTAPLPPWATKMSTLLFGRIGREKKTFTIQVSTHLGKYLRSLLLLESVGCKGPSCKRLIQEIFESLTFLPGSNYGSHVCDCHFTALCRMADKSKFFLLERPFCWWFCVHAKNA